MSNIQRKAYTEANLHLREASNATQSGNIACGRAICFNSPSEFMWLDNPNRLEREVILPEAITQEFLDTQDVTLNINHDDDYMLARSYKGEGSLKLTVKDDGVYFETELPNDMYGQSTKERLRRGDLKHCSFVFIADYYNPKYVTKRTEKLEDGRDVDTFYVKKVDAIRDVTMCIRPAYSSTECAARNLDANNIPNKENDNSEDDMNLTDENLDAIAERVCKKLREMSEADKENETKAEPEAPTETPAEDAPVNEETPTEVPAEDAPAEEPKKEEDETRECDPECEKDIEEIERALAGF